MVSAPRSASSRALSTARLPGQPPQFMNPTSSISPSTPSKAPPLVRIILKSVVPGQKSSVWVQRMIPSFTRIPLSEFPARLAPGGKSVYIIIAFLGQIPAQVPQATHLSSSSTQVFSLRSTVSAPAGHFLAQSVQ